MDSKKFTRFGVSVGAEISHKFGRSRSKLSKLLVLFYLFLHFTKMDRKTGPSAASSLSVEEVAYCNRVCVCILHMTFSTNSLSRRLKKRAYLLV